MVLESTGHTRRLMRDKGRESRESSTSQAASLPRNSATSCLCCRNLDYSLFTKSRRSFRCVVVDFKELRASAAAGCATCNIVNRAAQIFWGDEPETVKSIDADRSDRLGMLCYMTRKPGGCLRIFRYNARSYSADPVGWEWAYLMSIELFTDGGAIPAHPAFAPASTVQAQLTLELATSTIEAWLETCERTHALCRPAQHGTKLPSRVLDLSGGSVKLLETGGRMRGQYMTLSHCWGQDQALWPAKTTLANLDARKSGIPMTDLGRLFQDFIDLARRLGCCFIWIDSLCIIQDDPGDWSRESVQMAQVYSNSRLNVAATSLPNSHHTLFGQRYSLAQHAQTAANPNLPVAPLRTYTVSGDEAGPVSVRFFHDITHDVLWDGRARTRWPDEPLLDRAWVYQERLLSARTVHFCASEMAWECRSACACECGANTLDRQPESSSSSSDNDAQGDLSSLKQDISRIQRGDETISPQTAYGIWLRVVEGYSGLSLTNPEDKHYAIAGIAETFSTLLRDEYMYGIWQGDMARGLSWMSIAGSARLPTAPSWSWMSPAGKVVVGFSSGLHTFRPDERLTISLVKPRSPVTDPAGLKNQFGPNKDNTLQVTAMTRWASITTITRNNRVNGQRFRVSSAHSPMNLVLWADCPGMATGGDNLQEGDSCLCLLMGEDQQHTEERMLVLRSLAGNESASDEKHRSEDTFSRIGIAFGRRKEHYFQDSTAKMRTVMLV